MERFRELDNIDYVLHMKIPTIQEGEPFMLP